MKKSKWTEMARTAGWILVVFQLLLLAVFLITRGGAINRYFWVDGKDTGMDFFHSIEYVTTKNPYEQFGAIYPPLANLVFYLIYALVSQNYPILRAQDFNQSRQLIRSNMDLRTYQGPTLAFLLLITGCLVLILILIMGRLKGIAKPKLSIFAWGLIFNYGILQCIERGNILLLAFALLVIYLFYYDSEKWYLRECAILCLALSFGIKLFPAVFGVLLLKEKRYGLAARAAVYGSFSIILPSLFFKGGIAGIVNWIRILMSFRTNLHCPQSGSGFDAILYDIQALIKNLTGFELSDKWFSAAALSVSLLLVVVGCLLHKKWMTILCLSLVCILYQSQAEYIYTMMVLPMIFMVEEERTLTKNNTIPFFCVVLLNATVPLLYRYAVFYPRAIMAHVLMVALIVFVIIQFVKERHDEKLE